jgi:hypothetical protein
MCLPASPFGALMSGGNTAKTIGGGMLGGVSGALLASALAKKKQQSPAPAMGG